MDIPGYLIIAGIVLIGFILIFAISVENTIPLFLRSDFDNICNKYLRILSINGGLDAININNLKNELQNLGLINITVTAPSTSEWGSEVNLRVEAYYEYESTESDMSKKIELIPIEYNVNTIVFGLEN